MKTAIAVIAACIVLTLIVAGGPASARAISATPIYKKEYKVSGPIGLAYYHRINQSEVLTLNIWNLTASATFKLYFWGEDLSVDVTTGPPASNDPPYQQPWTLAQSGWGNQWITTASYTATLTAIGDDVLVTYLYTADSVSFSYNYTKTTVPSGPGTAALQAQLDQLRTDLDALNASTNSSVAGLALSVANLSERLDNLSASVAGQMADLRVSVDLLNASVAAAQLQLQIDDANHTANESAIRARLDDLRALVDTLGEDFGNLNATEQYDVSHLRAWVSDLAERLADVELALGAQNGTTPSWNETVAEVRGINETVASLAKTLDEKAGLTDLTGVTDEETRLRAEVERLQGQNANLTKRIDVLDRRLNSTGPGPSPHDIASSASPLASNAGLVVGSVGIAVAGAALYRTRRQETPGPVTEEEPAAVESEEPAPRQSSGLGEPATEEVDEETYENPPDPEIDEIMKKLDQ